MQPPPAGIWGLPPQLLKSVPGYDPDVAKNREEARAIMTKFGYGPTTPGGQGVGPQHLNLSRSRGRPNRPAQADLD